MSYEIRLSKPAKKFLASQPQFQQKRILKALLGLPFEGDMKKMVGPWTNRYRLRIGDYRAIYERHDETVTILVLEIGNREDIYK